MTLGPARVRGKRGDVGLCITGALCITGRLDSLAGYELVAAFAFDEPDAVSDLSDLPELDELLVELLDELAFSLLVDPDSAEEPVVELVEPVDDSLDDSLDEPLEDESELVADPSEPPEEPDSPDDSARESLR